MAKITLALKELNRRIYRPLKFAFPAGVLTQSDTE